MIIRLKNNLLAHTSNKRNDYSVKKITIREFTNELYTELLSKLISFTLIWYGLGKMEFSKQYIKKSSTFSEYIL
jgi:hypothetical protein